MGNKHHAATAEEALGALGRKIDEAFGSQVVGELQVQSALARMEAKQRLRPLVDRARISLDEVKRDLELVIETRHVADERDLRDNVAKAMTNLRAEIDAAPEFN